MFERWHLRGWNRIVYAWPYGLAGPRVQLRENVSAFNCLKCLSDTSCRTLPFDSEHFLL